MLTCVYLYGDVISNESILVLRAVRCVRACGVTPCVRAWLMRACMAHACVRGSCVRGSWLMRACGVTPPSPPPPH